MEIENLTIRISKASDEGYFYDIYLLDATEIDDDTESEDGGQCTSEDIKDALAMAYQQARDIVLKAKYNIKD